MAALGIIVVSVKFGLTCPRIVNDLSNAALRYSPARPKRLPFDGMQGTRILNYNDMEDVLSKTVINQQVKGIPMENALADLIAKLDEVEIEKSVMEQKISVYKQLNNRHKNIIDAQRVQLKVAEFSLSNQL